MITLPYIYVQKKEEIDFIKQVLPLFFRFVKEHKMMTDLYGYISFKKHGMFFMYSKLGFPSLVIDKLDFAFGDKIGYKKALVLSQLWRFYILEHINEMPHSIHQSFLLSDTIKEIKSNGTIGDEKLKQLFKKYKLS